MKSNESTLAIEPTSPGRDALVEGARGMVHMVSGAGAGAAPHEYYAGEYYTDGPFYLQQPPPLAAGDPHAPPHLCALHSDYGGVALGGASGVPLLGHVVQPVMDENGAVRHVLVPHPQPPHHYGPANGGNGPQQYYGPPTGYPPPHFHVHGGPPPPPPHHLQHSPPPTNPVYHKDERTYKQHIKLRRKLEQKQTTRSSNNGLAELNSGSSTPSLSPRKELNGWQRTATAGTSSEGEGSSAATSVQGDDDNTQNLLDMLSAARTPQVSEITSSSALVQWNTPIPPGITLPSYDLTYELLLGDKGRYKAIYSGPSLSCRVRDLQPGTEYSVCLQVRAGELTGAASGAATFRAPACEPGAPPALRASQRTRNSLLLRWGAAPDHGARLTHYVLECDTGDGQFMEIARPRTRQHTAQGLRSAARYRFRLAAVNERGRGPWSEDVTLWTCGAPPPAPTPPALVRATACDLLLSWPRRTPDEEYTLQLEDARTGHGYLTAYAGREGENLCEKLDRSTAYRFRLCAQNDEGASTWSSDVTYRTLPERPGAPGRPAVRGKIHSRSFRVRWEPPADDGGAPITSYTLELDGGEGYRTVYVGPEREAHCDRLEPGTTYRVRVHCETEGGAGDWSVAEMVTTEAVCPGPCATPALHARARSHAASLRWQLPDYDGGSPVTSYRLDVTDAADGRLTAYEGTETECTVEDLLPGREYRASVCASNRIGAGAWSPELRFSTGAAPPDTPPAPAVIARSPFHTFIEWTEPASNGAPILDYRLEVSNVSPEEAFAQAFVGLRTDCEVKNLTPFTNYFFRVCASNAAGQSDWSGVAATQTPRAPPAAPVALRAIATATELTVSWQAPASHGADVEHYLLEYSEGVARTEGPETECTLSGLAPETAYRVRVTAVSELGAGPASAALRVVTRPPPPAPPLLVCSQRGHNYFKLKWGEGKNAEFTQFCLEMEGPKFAEYQCVYRGTAYTCKIKKLQESTTYRFRIYASDDRGGRGAYSEPLALVTCAAPPGVPRALSATAETPRVAVLFWSPPEPTADEPFAYVVQCCSTKDQIYKQVYSGTETTCVVDELEPSVEYSWRACAVRGGLQGAWCVSARLAMPAAPPAPAAVPSLTAPRARRPRAPAALTDRHTALILLAGFMIVAVLVAAAVEQFINWRT